MLVGGHLDTTGSSQRTLPCLNMLFSISPLLGKLFLKKSGTVQENRKVRRMQEKIYSASLP